MLKILLQQQVLHLSLCLDLVHVLSDSFDQFIAYCLAPYL